MPSFFFLTITINKISMKVTQKMWVQEVKFSLFPSYITVHCILPGWWKVHPVLPGIYPPLSQPWSEWTRRMYTEPQTHSGPSRHPLVTWSVLNGLLSRLADSFQSPIKVHTCAAQSSVFWRALEGFKSATAILLPFSMGSYHSWNPNRLVIAVLKYLFPSYLTSLSYPLLISCCQWCWANGGKIVSNIWRKLDVGEILSTVVLKLTLTTQTNTQLQL